MINSRSANTHQRILWVEDDYYHLQNLARGLRQQYDVVPAESYMEAVAALENWRDFCLVLLDLIIPYSNTDATPPQAEPSDTDRGGAQNGIRLFRYMKDTLKINIPIVLVSVMRTEQIIEELMRGGATDRLYKSGLLPDDLEKLVSRVLNKVTDEGTNSDKDLGVL